jgi:AcrR family transcriptional regulator
MEAEPTRPNRHERRRLETRDRIARTALDLFTARGYDAVTIAEIAEAADVAKQTVVNHFPAKEDLLLAFHRPVEADIIDMIGHLPLSTPLPEFLRTELPRLFTDPPPAPDSPGQRGAEVGAVIMNSPTLQDALRRRGTRYQQDLADILESRPDTPTGPVATRALAAYLLTTVAALVEETIRLRGTGRPAEQVTATLTEATEDAVRLLEHGLVSRRG